MNSYFKYMPLESFIHNVNPLIKYFINIILVLLLPFMSGVDYVFLVIFLYTSVILANINLFYFHRGLKFLIYLYLIIAVLTLIYPNMGVDFLVTSMIRIYIVVSYALLVIMTTKFSDLVLFFNLLFRFLKPETREKLLFIIILILSFIPIILKNLTATKTALKSRGLNFKASNFIQSSTFLFTTLLKNIDFLTDSYDLAIYGRGISHNNISYLNFKYKTTKLQILYIMIFVVTLGVL